MNGNDLTKRQATRLVRPIDKTRKLEITAINDGFRVETSYLGGAGYWTVLSRTITQAFPLHIVSRVANRSDYSIYVR